MRTTDIKYLGFGLGVGALIASLFFAGFFFLPQSKASNSLFGISTFIPTITPTPESTATITASPTASATFTPTATPTATLTPTATATQTVIESMIANGELAITGPLTKEEQIKLYEGSLTLIALTYEQAQQISVLVNHVRFSDPSTTCGPLSIAILQKAGVLSEEINAHDFFLINPTLGKDRGIINNVFPPEKYSSTRYRTRIDQVDWNTNPLMPGDFVYIYKGTGGNFEHMLVVNRVDTQGRAYAVTNYNTEQGFIINETMLYDPADANAGIFSTWTEKQFAKLGSTGFSGFEVWRQIK